MTESGNIRYDKSSALPKSLYEIFIYVLFVRPSVQVCSRGTDFNDIE